MRTHDTAGSCDEEPETLAQAWLLFTAAAEAQVPYAAAFDAATTAIAQLLRDRARGAPITKADILAAYDERMLAGQAWRPHRERYRQAVAWLKRLKGEAPGSR